MSEPRIGSKWRNVESDQVSTVLRLYDSPSTGVRMVELRSESGHSKPRAALGYFVERWFPAGGEDDQQ